MEVLKSTCALRKIEASRPAAVPMLMPDPPSSLVWAEKDFCMDTSTNNSLKYLIFQFKNQTHIRSAATVYQGTDIYHGHVGI
jgi:hypothetical protein